MALKGAMRGRQALKRWRLAEERQGESPEARIALWLRNARVNHLKRA